MTVSVTLPAGGVLKQAILAMAFEDCGLSDFDITPEEYGKALRRLNALMAEEPWNALPYAQPVAGEGIPDDASGLEQGHVHGVAMLLALRLAPMLGKTLSREWQAQASQSINRLRASIATIPTISFTQGTPRGAGHRTAFIMDPFFPVAE